MVAPSDSDVLAAWDLAQGLGPAARALALLAAFHPQEPVAELACLSLGQRDARLLAVWERWIGDTVTGFATCPSCGSQLDIELQSRELRTAAPDGLLLGDPAAKATPQEAFALDSGEWAVKFRLPDSTDVSAMSRCRSTTSARVVLLQRCVLWASRGGVEVGGSELPDSIVALLAQRLAACDPQAEILVPLQCPDCAHAWQTILDVATLLWGQVNVHAPRLLREVHTLAAAYGWLQEYVLELHPARRRLFLEMVGA